MRLIFPVLILSLIIASSRPELILQPSTQIFPTNSLNFAAKGAFAEISGPVLVVDFGVDGPHLIGLNTTGTIIFLVNRSLRLTWDWIRSSQDGPTLGIQAIVIHDGDDDGIGGLDSFPSGMVQFPYPVVGVGLSAKTAVSLLALEGSVYANLTDVSIQNHYYDELKTPFFWFLRVFFPILFYAVAILGLGRLILICRSLKSFKPSVVNIAIVLEVIGTIIRAIYWSVDPFGAVKLLGNISRNIFHTVSIPFTLSSTLILSFYWHETVNRTSLRFTWSIERLRIPAYTIVILIFIFEIVIDSLALFLKTRLPGMSTVQPILYFIFAFTLGCFFFITSVRIILKLNRMITPAMKRINHKSFQRTRSVAIKLLISCIGLFGTIAGGVVPNTEPFARFRPSYIIYTWSTIHFALTIKAVFTILAIRVPKHGSLSHRHQHHANLTLSAKDNLASTNANGANTMTRNNLAAMTTSLKLSLEDSDDYSNATASESL